MTEKSTGEISSSNKDEICKENGQENEPTPRYGALRFQPKYSNDPVTSHVSGEITYPPANQTAEKDVEMRNSANHMHYKDTMSSTEDRDPGRINEEIKIQFEDVFAEPEGTHSLDPIWNASSWVFTKSKLWCYRILSSVCGVPCSLYWGIHFACLGFAQIWIYTPGLKSFSIQVLPAARIFSVCMRWFVAPWCEACGKIFSGIRIQKLSK